MYSTIADSQINTNIISTGHPEIDRKMGGGVPMGSLTLVEGQSDAGKSVLCQQLMWGSLKNGHKVLVFTSENSPRSLLSQMDSLGLGVLDYMLLGKLKIFSMKPSEIQMDSHRTFEIILDTIGKYHGYQLVVLDSLTPIISGTNDTELLNYFERCKVFCDKNVTILNVIHSNAVDNNILVRLRSACDAHLKLTLEKIGDKLVKTLEVAKIRGAADSTGNIVTFEVEPEMGMKIMPLRRAFA
jgi:flagellar protein FlaH